MSVVAGCSLLDGVLLAADCRVTIPRHGSADLHADNVQKIFPVCPATAIGFVGHLDVASHLLRLLLTQVQKRKRKDPISLSSWMPRLFRGAYGIFCSKKGPRSIIFMVASTLKDRPNVVERKAIADLVEYIGFQKGPIRRSWMPGIFVEILKAPSKYEYVAIPGTSRGLLYVMRSPLFEIEPYRPLQFCAIGSGESAYEEIAKYHDGIVAFHPGNSFIESSFLRDTVQRFLDEKGIESVGGLYPTLKVSGKGTELLGQSATIPVGGPKIELAIKDNRWIQRNHETGKEIRLLYPWEVKGEPITEDYKFDDLKEAYRKFRGED